MELTFETMLFNSKAEAVFNLKANSKFTKKQERELQSL
jgi:hypothetical protein